MNPSRPHTDVCSGSLQPAARGPPLKPIYHSLRGDAAATAQKNRQRAATQLPAIITLNRATQRQLKLRRWRDDRDGTSQMSTKIQKESSGPAGGMMGINPDCMYTADEIRQWMRGGEKLAREMAAAGFRWRVATWRERTKFCLGRDLIEFICRE